MTPKKGPQQQGTHWAKRLLDPIGDWLTDRAMSRYQDRKQKKRQYLSKTNPDSCRILLTKILCQLLKSTKDVDRIFESVATMGHSGKLGWKMETLAGFLRSRLSGNMAMTASIPVLWGIFCTAAAFPFSIQSSDPLIDIDEFRRAFVFLATRGYELLGTVSDGSTPDWRDDRESYADKVRRLTRIIYRSLSSPCPQSATQSQASHDSLQLQDIRDTIFFAQPVVPQGFPFQPLRNTDEEWEAAARQVLLADHKESGSGDLPLAVKKDNLQNILQLLFLQRMEDRCWRVGLDFHSVQRSGDIMHSQFCSEPDEISQAIRLAFAFLAHQFPSSEDYVTWEQFQVHCTECPYFVFTFFQLWATLFTSTTTSLALRPEETDNLSVAITNALSFLNVTRMASGLGSNDRYHTNELGLQLDLQAAKLVARVAVTSELSVEYLYSIVAQRNTFHIILLRGESLDPDRKGSGTQIAAFTSSPEEEMWRRVEGKRFVQYIWRASIVQLEPDIVVSNNGGMSVSIEDGELLLQSHNISREGRTRIRVNLANRVINIERPTTRTTEGTTTERGAEAATLAIRLIRIECYRMPGYSAKTTASAEGKRYWQE